jgi:Zn-finger nucleic acid-binding protein
MVDATSGALVCTHCGSIEQQPAIIRTIEIVGASQSACPTCAVALERGHLNGRPLLLCQRCNGMLIAMADFVSVIDAARALEDRHGIVLPRQQHPGEREIRCPTCARPMLNHVYGGPGNLMIDSCEDCQVNWLDSGELRRIARA